MKSWFDYGEPRRSFCGRRQSSASVFVPWRARSCVSYPSFAGCLVSSTLVVILVSHAASAGAGAVEVVASGSGILCGAVDAMSGAVEAVRGVCSRASTLVGLVHDHLMPEDEKLPDGLDTRVAAVRPKGNLVSGLVAENVVSGLSTSLVVLMGHGVTINDSLVETIPDYTDEQSA